MRVPRSIPIRAGLPAALLVLLLAAPAPFAGAASSMSLSHAGGGVAFTFDAGYASGTTAASILESHGMRGTFYVVSGQLRQGSAYADYLSAQDVANLSARGHEIGSMTASQADLTTLDPARLDAELSGSRAALESITGKTVASLAYPYGSVDDAVASAAASYYSTGRAISWYVTDFTPTVDAYRLPGFIVRSTTSLSEAKYVVDYAAANNVYVVLSFGRIVASPGTYDWTPSDLDALAAYVQSKGVATSTVSPIRGVPPPPPPGGTPSGASVVFTFDDGQADQLDAARILESHGLRGTFFIVSNCARSEVDVDCMDKAQVQGLSRAGHDVQSHTVLHHDLTTLGPKQLANELTNSRSTLQTWTGKPVSHLAYPYGAQDAGVRAQAAKSYKTARIYLADPAPSDLPALLAQSGSDPLLLPGIGVTKATPLARAEAYVDYAVSRNTTVVLVFHDILASGGDAYSWSPSDLDALAAYAVAARVPVRTMAQAYG